MLRIKSSNSTWIKWIERWWRHFESHSPPLIAQQILKGNFKHRREENRERIFERSTVCNGSEQAWFVPLRHIFYSMLDEASKGWEGTVCPWPLTLFLKSYFCHFHKPFFQVSGYNHFWEHSYNNCLMSIFSRVISPDVMIPKAQTPRRYSFLPSPEVDFQGCLIIHKGTAKDLNHLRIPAPSSPFYTQYSSVHWLWMSVWTSAWYWTT